MSLAYAGLTIPAAAALNAVAGPPRGLAAAGSRALIPVIYGTDRVSALILNVIKSASDANIVLVQCLWGHQCTTVDQPRLNDQALSGGTTATHYTGSQSSADSALVSAFAAQSITYADTLAGYAYSVFGLPVREFNGQLNFSARIAGRKLYDPRKDSTNGGSGSHRLATPSTWEYSDNPSLALGDWLYSTLYGAGESVLWSSVITAANANDTMVGSPSEKHRLIGVTLSDAAPVPAMAEALRAYAGCWLVPTSGGIKLLPDADGSAAASYVHASGQIAALDGLALRDLGNVPTVVDVVYTDTSQVPYRDATATVQVSGAGTTLPWRMSTVRLPGVQRYSQAYREAFERLKKLQLNDLSTSLEVFDAGLAHDVGDIVNVTHPLGITGKPFRVVDVDMPAPGRWRLQLVEHDPGAYDTSVSLAPTYADTSRLSPAGPPPSVSGLAAAVVEGGARIYWTPATVIDYAETELRVGGASWAAGTLLFKGNASEFVWLAPAQGTYTVRAKHWDDQGNESTTAASISVTIDANALVSWTSLDGRPMMFRATSRGHDDANAPFSGEGGLSNGETGAGIHANIAASGFWMVCKIARSTGGVTFIGRYNQYTAGQSDAMAGALNAIGSDYIVVVTTTDEPQSGTKSAGWYAAMYRCGASRAVCGSPAFQYRSAYVLVGIGACGEGNGFEAYSGSTSGDTNAWCDVAFYLQNSNLVISGSAATPRTLVDYSYTGDLNATYGSTWSLVTGAAKPQDNATVGATSGTNLYDQASGAVLGDTDIVTQQGQFTAYTSWHFQGSDDGWSASGCTLTTFADVLRVTSTGGDPYIHNEKLLIPGDKARYVRAKISRASGSGTGWDGAVYYATGGHGYSASYYKSVPVTIPPGQTRVVQWDMGALTAGGSDWITNSITGLRFDWGTGATDDFYVDWIEAGNYSSSVAPGTATQRLQSPFPSTTTLYSGTAISSLTTYDEVHTSNFTTTAAGRVFGAIAGTMYTLLDTAGTQYRISHSCKLQLVRVSDDVVVDESGQFGGDTLALLSTSIRSQALVSASLVFENVPADVYYVRLWVSVLIEDSIGSPASHMTECKFGGEISAVEFKV